MMKGEMDLSVSYHLDVFIPLLSDSQLVIKGSHMVSGTRCPARSDPVKKWSESRAAAPKGQCPVTGRAKNFVLCLLLENLTYCGSYELKFEPEYLSWSY